MKFPSVRGWRSRNCLIAHMDRTQPSLPMKKGRAGTMTHDYKRNGTTTLFAVLKPGCTAEVGLMRRV